MMPPSRVLVLFWVAALAGTGIVHAQGRGGGAWTTAGGDAQRTNALRTDPRISVESAQKPGFQLLWKRQLAAGSRTPSPSQPVLLPNIISYKGFKALAFLGAGDAVYSIDYDLNRVFWERRLAPGAAPSGNGCERASAVVTRSTPLWQGGGTPSRGSGPGGRGAPAGVQGRGRAGGGAGGRGGGNNVWAVSSVGMVHTLNPQTGEDMNPPARLAAGGAGFAGAVFVNGVLYAAARGSCAGVANGVYAIDLAENGNTVTSWDSKGAPIAGSLGPAFGADGTIYVATGRASGPDTSFENAVIALDSSTLTAKDWFTADAPFTSSPSVFMAGERMVVAASNADGSLYVLDASALGGPDHRTPLAKSPRYSTGRDFTPGALSAWSDADGTRWIAVATAGKPDPAAAFQSSNGAISNGGVVAFKLDAGSTAPALQPAWSSRDIAAPGSPIVLNGVVFAVSNGDYRAGAGAPKRGGRAVLYALDAATGKELWNSGNAIASYVPGVPLSGGDGQVYVATADGTLYAFGIPLEH